MQIHIYAEQGAEVLNLAIKLYNLCVLPRSNPLLIDNRVINYSNLVSPIPMHNLGNILEILTFNTSEQGDIAGVAREIANGVDIDSSEEFSQRTPLMCALSSSNAGIDMIQFLCKNGANIHAVEQESQHNTFRLRIKQY